MVHDNYVAIDAMRDKLLTVDDVKERLAATEPLTEHTFPTGSNVVFNVASPWASSAADAAVDASLVTAMGGATYQLTRGGLQEALSEAGIPRKTQAAMPVALQTDVLNWWFQDGAGDRNYKLLALGQQSTGATEAAPAGTVLAMCRGTVSPYSNLALLEAILARLEARYGSGERLVDYKFVHDLEQTHMRLIVPGASRVIENERDADDTWSLGLDYTNSMIGQSQLDVAGYLFRWWCTNGCTDTLRSGGGFSRRGSATEADAVEWANTSIDTILGEFEGAFDDVQALTEIPVEGEVSLVLEDLFERSSVPRKERHRVTNAMADVGGNLTLYDVQNAITRAANAEDVSPRAVRQLMALGGHVVHATGGRCDGSLPDGCRRLLPEGYEVPELHHAETPEPVTDSAPAEAAG